MTSKGFYDSKVDYIYSSPVKAVIVEKEEEYLYSICGDYHGIRKGILELAME